MSLTYALALILCNFIYSLFVTIEIGFSLKSQFSYQLFVTITEKITNEESSYWESPPSSTSCSLPHLQLYLPLAIIALLPLVLINGMFHFLLNPNFSGHTLDTILPFLGSCSFMSPLFSRLFSLFLSS